MKDATVSIAGFSRRSFDVRRYTKRKHDIYFRHTMMRVLDRYKPTVDRESTSLTGSFDPPLFQWDDVLTPIFSIHTVPNSGWTAFIARQSGRLYGRCGKISAAKYKPFLHQTANKGESLFATTQRTNIQKYTK